MKNVLILSYYFPPAPLAYSQRIGKLCKYLPRETHWVPQVITAELPWDILPGRDDVLLSEIPENVSIERVGNFVSSNFARKLRSWNLYRPLAVVRKILSASDAYSDWISRATAAAERKFPGGKGIDVIYACGPPNSVYLAGKRLSTFWDIPLVLDMRDPWEPLWENHQWANRIYRRLMKRQEQSAFQVAKAIIVNTSGAAAELKRRFKEFSGKIEVIPNGFDPEDMDWGKGPNLRQQDEPEGTVHLLNLGGFRGGNLEFTLFKALSEYLQERPEETQKIKVHFIGASPAQIAQITSSLKGLENICRGYGVIPTNEVGRPLAEADIYTLLQPGRYASSIPSKLFSYLAGGGYIFALLPLSLAHELQDKFNNSLEIFEFAEPSTVKIALKRIIERARRTKRPRSANSFPEYALLFDRRHIARQVGEMLDEVTLAV